MIRFNETTGKALKAGRMLALIIIAFIGCAYLTKEANAGRVVVRTSGILPARVIIRPGRIVTVLPAGCTVVRINGGRFFYHAGVFYSRRGSTYAVVTPPAGALIQVLPVGYTTQIYGGITYFSYNGVFYRKVSGGFRVVSLPIQMPAVQTVSVNINALIVRTGPGLNYPRQGTVYRNTILEVSDSIPGWIYVRLPSGTQGWIAEQYVIYNPSPPLG